MKRPIRSRAVLIALVLCLASVVSGTTEDAAQAQQGAPDLTFVVDGLIYELDVCNVGAFMSQFGSQFGQGSGDRLGQGSGDRLGFGPGGRFGQGSGDRLGFGPGGRFGQGSGDRLGQGPWEVDKLYISGGANLQEVFDRATADELSGTAYLVYSDGTQELMRVKFEGFQPVGYNYDPTASKGCSELRNGGDDDGGTIDPYPGDGIETLEFEASGTEVVDSSATP